MPKPPFSAFLGLRGSVSERIMTNSPLIERDIPKIERKISHGLPVPQFVSNFVSTVDTSSIYDDKQPETRIDNNRVFHVLKAQTPKFDDYQSPELLPEHMIELKVRFIALFTGITSLRRDSVELKLWLSALYF